MMRSWTVCGFLSILVLGLLTACGSKPPEELLLEAQEKMSPQVNDIFAATLILEDLIKKHPDHPAAIQAKLALGFCYYRDRQFGQAQEILDEYIVEAGGVDTAAGFQGVMHKIVAYGAANEPQLAHDYMMETSPTLRGLPEPDLRTFQLQYPRVLMALDRVEEAREYLKTMLFTGPETPEIHEMLIRQLFQTYTAEEDAPKLVTFGDEYLSRYPDSVMAPDVILSQAMYYKSRGLDEPLNASIQQAETMINKRVEETVSAEEKSMYLVRLANILRLNPEREQEAEEMLTSVIDEYQMSQQRPMALVVLADLKNSQGDVTAAKQVLNRLVNEYPNTQFQQAAMRMLQMMAQQPPAGAGGVLPGAPVGAAQDALSSVGAALQGAAGDLATTGAQMLEDGSSAIQAASDDAAEAMNEAGRNAQSGAEGAMRQATEAMNNPLPESN